MGKEKSNRILLDTTKDGWILRRGIGTNPDGDRFLYDIAKDAEAGINIVRNTGFIAISATNSVDSNLYPGEGGPNSRFKISDENTSRFFVRI